MQNKGVFIVFEGIDGAGKTTQISMLADRLKADGRHIYTTAEPTQSTTGGLIRDALEGITKRSPEEMATLFATDRVFHNINPVSGIQKLTLEGQDVICDRYYYSSLAYQGSQTDYDWVSHMNLDCPAIRIPDICIFLDLTPEASMKRISKGRAVTEIYENLETLTKVRNQFYCVFETLRGRDNICIIDADRPIDAIAEDIYQVVCKVISK